MKFISMIAAVVLAGSFAFAKHGAHAVPEECKDLKGAAKKECVKKHKEMGGDAMAKDAGADHADHGKKEEHKP